MFSSLIRSDRNRRYAEFQETSRQKPDKKEEFMFIRFIIAVAVALFFTPAVPVRAQEHPEHPKKTAEHPTKGGEKKGVRIAEISSGIKKHLADETKQYHDRKFHA